MPSPKPKTKPKPPPTSPPKSSSTPRKKHRLNRSSSWSAWATSNPKSYLKSSTPSPPPQLSSPPKNNSKTQPKSHRFFSLGSRPRSPEKSRKERERRNKRSVTFEDESVWTLTSSSKLGEIPPEKLTGLIPADKDVDVSVPGGWRSSFSLSEEENGRDRDQERYRGEEKRGKGRVRARAEQVRTKNTARRERRSFSLSRVEEFLRLRPSPKRDFDERGAQRDFVYRYEDPEPRTYRGSGDDRDDERGRSRQRNLAIRGEIQRRRARSTERNRVKDRDTDLRPSDSVSCQGDRPAPYKTEVQTPRADILFIQPHPGSNYRRANMRTVSSDDYLLARGANPRTGVVSPSVWSMTGSGSASGSSRGTPSPGPIYPDLSPSGKKTGNPFGRLRGPRKERAGSDQKWRLRGEEWISLGVDEPTPGPSPPPEDKQRRQVSSQRHGRTSQQAGVNPDPSLHDRIMNEVMNGRETRKPRNVPLRELQDKFVVNMPSAQEPSPPQMSLSMIEEYQRGLQRIAGEGGVMVDPAKLKKNAEEQKSPRNLIQERPQIPITPPRARREERGHIGMGAGVLHAPLTPITEQSGSTALKDTGRIRRKPVGSPASPKSPPGSPAGEENPSLETVVRQRGDLAQDQGRARSVPTPSRRSEERRVPSWHSPDDVGKEQASTRERSRSQGQNPFLGRGTGGGRHGADEMKEQNLSSSMLAQGHPLYETTMNAIRFPSPLYSKAVMPVVQEEKMEKENREGEVQRGGANERDSSHQLEQDHSERVAGCKCCRNEPSTHEKGDARLPLPYLSFPPKNQPFPGQHMVGKLDANILITTTTITPTSIPITTTFPARIIPLPGPRRQEPVNAAGARRPRPRPQRADGAVAVPQVNLHKAPPRPRPALMQQRSFFLPPKVDLLGGWDVVGTGKAVKIEVARGGATGGRVPKALVPDKGEERRKCRCRCQGTGSMSFGPRERDEDTGRGEVMKMDGAGRTRIEGLEGDKAGENFERCWDCRCGHCGGDGLRVRAIHNGMRMRKVRVTQKDGEIAELETLMGSVDEEDSGADWSEMTAGDGENRNDSVEALLLKPLSLKKTADFGAATLTVPQDGDGKDGAEKKDATPEDEPTPSELDPRLSSLLDLIHHTSTLLHKHKAPERLRGVLRKLAGMAVHIFQTAVKLHETVLLQRYYNPKERPGQKKGKEDKEKKRLEIVKLTRDCAVAVGELLVLFGAAVLVGRIGLTIMGCVRWIRWIGGWLGWFLRGLFWG